MQNDFSLAWVFYVTGTSRLDYHWILKVVLRCVWRVVTECLMTEVVERIEYFIGVIVA